MTPLVEEAAAVRDAELVVGGLAERYPPVRIHREIQRPTGQAIVLPGSASGRRGGYVLAAIDGDGNAGKVIGYARTQANRLGMPLRLVHVWTGEESVSQADRLLSEVLYEHLPPGEVEAAERQIVHDGEPTDALRALSRDGALLVMASASRSTVHDRPLGDTARRLAGRTECPLAILPATGPAKSW